MHNFNTFSSFAKNRLVDVDSNYDVVYEAVMSNLDYFSSFNHNAIKKIKLLDKMIEFYENKEDYRKCANLAMVKNEIHKNAKN